MSVEAILDTGALLAYVHGVDRVGELLFRASEEQYTVGVPSTCLLEVAPLLSFDDELDMLRLLRTLPQVRVLLLSFDVYVTDDLPIVGGMVKAAGRLGAGHTAFAAASNSAAVFTSQAHQIESVLGKSWPIVEV